MLYDRATIKGAARITRDGYFVADALVARADNIQEYLAHEIGLEDRDPLEIVRIFRPAGEVFSKDAMASLAHRPITLDHPKDMVTADNWKSLAVGDVGDEIARDGEFIRVPIKIMDAEAINSLQTERKEFSLGYSVSLDMTPGEHAGQAYDGVARQFRYNHLAAVKAARGGTDLRIVDERTYSAPSDGDTKTHQRRETVDKGNSHMATKTIIVDGLQVEVTDAAEAAINKLQGQLTVLTADKAAAEGKVDTLTAEKVTLDAKVAELEQAVKDAKPTAAQLRDAAKAYAATADKAKALGVTVSDEMDEPAIIKAAVTAKLGDKAEGWSDAQFAAAFATMDAKVDPVRQVIAFGKASNITDTSAIVEMARTGALKASAK